MEEQLHLEADGLGIIRGERILFRDVSLAIGAGEALLLRGANGAGKTTLLRCLAGLARPESGQCERSEFHWLGHRTGVKPHETPELHIKTWAMAYGADSGAAAAAISLMGLDQVRDVAGAQLSAGQRKRTALARTQLVSRPLWILDEPFSALDPEGKHLLADLIAKHRSNGGAVIAAVHGEVPILDAREVRL